MCKKLQKIKTQHVSIQTSSAGPQTSQPTSAHAHAACKSPGHVMGCCPQSSPSQDTQAEAQQHQSGVFLAVQRLESEKITIKSLLRSPLAI